MKKILFSLLFAGIVGSTVNATQHITPLPWHDDFESHDNVGLIDSNNDYIGFGLNYNPSTGSFDSFAYDGREAYKDADDWMIFPWFHFEEGLQYKITMRVKHTGPSTADYECMLVTGDDEDDDLVVTDSAIKLGETWVVSTDANDVWQEVSAVVTSTVTGDYRFAFHFISRGRDKYYIDWLTIGEGLTPQSPDAATVNSPTYKVIDNKLNVEFKITPPANTHTGLPLASGLTAKIVRRAENAADKEFTLSGLAPSTQATFVDPDGIGTGSEYDVYICNGDSRGIKKIVTAKPTFGYPKSPANVKITHLSGNHFSVAWDAVTASTSSSALFNPASVKYVAKLPDSGMTQIPLVMKDATSAEFDYPEPVDTQVGAYINMYAVNERGESTAGKSNIVVIGPALQPPFHESFSNAKFQNETWGLNPATGAWVLNGSGVTPHDDDKGMIRYAQSNGMTGELISPTLDLSGMTRPFVRFWVYKKPASTLASTVDIVMRGYEEEGQDVVVFEGIDDHTIASDDPDPTQNGWREYIAQINLPAEKLSQCNLVFKGTGANSYTYIYIDDISISDYPMDNDIELTSVILPKKIEVGKDADIQINVANRGIANVESFEVKMISGDETVATVDGGALNRFESKTVTIPYKALPHEAGEDVILRFELVCAGDENIENNSKDVVMSVGQSLLPVVENLDATVNGDEVLLTWSTPQRGESGFAEVTEDFEEWSDGALNGEVGGWKFVDIDGLPTKGYGSDDPAYKTTIGAEIYSQGGVDGTRGLYVPNCYGNNGLLYGKPDKWIILPELQPGSTVKLSRLGFNVYGNSSAIEIDYCTSEGGIEPADFDNIISSEKINSKTLANATENEFTLPANATRFAIHVKDCQAKAVGFDNFSFTRKVGAPELLAYEIYCDYNMVGTAEAQADSYVYQLVNRESVMMRVSEKDSHSFYVAAVYDQGHSAAGPIIEVSTPTSISSLQGDEQASPQYYNLQGVPLNSKPSSGIYIIRQGDKIFKVLAK